MAWYMCDSPHFEIVCVFNVIRPVTFRLTLDKMEIAHFVSRMYAIRGPPFCVYVQSTWSYSHGLLFPPRFGANCVSA